MNELVFIFQLLRQDIMHLQKTTFKKSESNLLVRELSDVMEKYPEFEESLAFQLMKVHMEMLNGKGMYLACYLVVIMCSGGIYVFSVLSGCYHVFRWNECDRLARCYSSVHD